MAPDDLKGNPSVMRLDAALVMRGLVDSRERAKQHILAGEVLLNGHVVKKAATAVRQADALLCEGQPLHYVGRGGLKLEKALSMGGYNVYDACAMDVGASTGGFTDCLLQNGARLVYAIDVGHGQLHPKLASDPRVRNLEGTDVRDGERLRQLMEPASVDFCTIDVSFISVTKLFDAILPFLKQDAGIVCLIKPQFEAGRGAVGKNGVVKDAAVHRRVINDLCMHFALSGCSLRELTYSPITGGNGNIEYLALLQYGGETNLIVDSAAIVDEAHRILRG